MNPIRTTIATAVRLAARRQGVTPGELSEVVSCSLRVAQRNLAALVAEGLLEAEVPERKGHRRGDWRNVYRLAKDGSGSR